MLILRSLGSDAFHHVAFLEQYTIPATHIDPSTTIQRRPYLSDSDLITLSCVVCRTAWNVVPLGMAYRLGQYNNFHGPLNEHFNRSFA